MQNIVNCRSKGHPAKFRENKVLFALIGDSREGAVLTMRTSIIDIGHRPVLVTEMCTVGCDVTRLTRTVPWYTYTTVQVPP